MTSECILWAGRVDSDGYGRLGGALAHRLVYESEVAPIPVDLTIDHLCRTRACVNAAHMEPVSRGVNTLRGFGPTAENARKAACDHGHPFTPENTYITPEGNRQCRACGVERSRRYRERRAAA